MKQQKCCLSVSLMSESYSLTTLINIHLKKTDNFKKLLLRDRCLFKMVRCLCIKILMHICKCKHTRKSTEAQWIHYITRIIHRFSFIKLKYLTAQNLCCSRPWPHTSLPKFQSIVCILLYMMRYIDESMKKSFTICGNLIYCMSNNVSSLERCLALSVSSFSTTFSQKYCPLF